MFATTSSSTVLEPVLSVASEGRFALALERLNAIRTPADKGLRWDHETLKAELALEVGRLSEAVRIASSLLEEEDASFLTIAQSRRILALASYYQGNSTSTLSHLAAAKAAALKCNSDRVRAYIELLDFQLSLTLQPLEMALSRLPHVRKAVAQVGEAGLLVLLRVAVGRAEARRFTPSEAQRHHRAALSLLQGNPNVWLEGLVYIDMAAVSMLLGDLLESLQWASRALELSSVSGHARTRLAALINTAQIYEWRGNFAGARKCMDEAMRSVEGNAHLLRAATDGLVNMLISTGDCGEARRLLESEQPRPEGTGRPHWDAVTELFTRARLAQAEGDWPEASRTLTSALKLASESGDSTWVRRIRVSRARCFGFERRVDDALEDLREWYADQATDPESLSRYYAAVATLERVSGDSVRAAEKIGRALRIAAEMAHSSVLRDLQYGNETLSGSGLPEVEGTLPHNDLDSAVALLELSGHPRILGREAFALLQGTGSVESAALLTTEPDVRVLAAFGWTEDEVRRAVAAAQPDDFILVGRHRDETWQILVRPRAELDHRCTLAAIRKLMATARTLDEFRREEKQRAALWPAEAFEGDPESIWASEQTAELLTIARRIAAAPVPILITGETGTGKELLAREIHRASDRPDRPMIPFNCSAVPRDLLESQLFGHRRGAFTGADTAFPGVIRAASGGTLFLDEIGEVGLDLQVKLLRFLENHEIHPLGETQPLKIDVRIIAATNANLEQLVAQGRFREDLFYRLDVVRLKIPPLRERREEIPTLVQHYIRLYAEEHRKGRLSLSDEALEYLLLYGWPGNVRQLANEVRRMVALAEPDSTLTPAVLSPEIQASRRTVPVSVPAEPEFRVRLDQPLPAAVEALEQLMVRRALERTRGRVEEAARMLGISRKGLFLKRRRWGLRQAS